MKSNQRKLILLLSLGLGGSILILGIAMVGWFFIAPNYQSEPMVNFTYPSDHTVVTSGEEVALVCQAKAENSIQRIDLLLNDVLAEQYFPQSADKTSLQTSFIWFTSTPGIHKLTVIAYDQRDRASPPDHLVVGVALNPTSSQEIIIPEQNILEEQSSEETEEGEAEPGEQISEESVESESEEGEQVSGESVESESEEGEQVSDESAEGEPGEGVDFSDPNEEEALIVDEEELIDFVQIPILDISAHFSGMAEIEGMIAGVNPEDSFPIIPGNLQSDFPPEILTVETNFIRQPDVMLTVSGQAQDDHGIDHIKISILHDLYGGFHQTTQNCNNTLVCDFLYTFPVSHGRWLMLVDATDSTGQTSAPYLHDFQVIEGEQGNPPAVADEGPADDYDEDVGIGGEEFNIYGSNPNTADSDGDGLSDAEEINIYGSNPNTADSDGDGLSDAEELNIYGSNPNTADSDADGLSDAEPIPEQSGDLLIEVEIHPEGYLVRWEIPEAASWYKEGLAPPPASYFAEILAYDAENRQAYVVSTVFNSEGSSLPASGEVIDRFINLEWCGRPYTYTIRIIETADQHIMAQSTAEAPLIPCIPRSMHTWDISVDSYFRRVPGGSYAPYTLITMYIPDGIPYSQPRMLVVDIYKPFGQADTEIFEIDGGTLGRDGITYQVERQELMNCGAGEHKFTFSVLEDLRNADWEGVWRGITYDTISIWKEPLPCLPGRSTGLQLTARMCDGIQPCVKVSWAPPYPFEGRIQYPTDEVFLNKQTFLEDSTVVNGFHLPPDQTNYIDYDVVPGQIYQYKIFYMHQNMYSSALQMNIQSPSSDVWDCEVHGDAEMWCE
jgi:hypothetical protein